MSSFVFITDLHLKLTNNVRTGSYLDDLIAKLDWTIQYCNKTNSHLLVAGDLFDTPSVPDIVKARVIKSLYSLNRNLRIFGCNGNHDRLYDNPEFDEKTSWNILTSAGLITDLDDGAVGLEDVTLTSTVPIVDYHRPTIALFHGFLNQEDGRNTFRFTDIQTKSPCFVCLGHDHVEYENLPYGDNVRIIRPGSFSRTTRADESMRQPKLVHIVVRDGKLLSKNVPIEAARPYSEIFSTKEAKMTPAQQSRSYQEIISALSSASTTQLTFEQAIATVGQPDVVEYTLKLLQEARLDKQTKKNNL